MEDFKLCDKVSSKIVGLTGNKIVWELEDCQNSLGRLGAFANCHLRIVYLHGDENLSFSLQECIKSSKVENGNKMEDTWLSLVVRRDSNKNHRQAFEIRVHCLDEEENIASSFPTMYAVFEEARGNTWNAPKRVLCEEFICVSEVTKDAFGEEIERNPVEQPRRLRYGITAVPLFQDSTRNKSGQRDASYIKSEI